MAARTCPKCQAVIPSGEIAAHTNDLVCPGCGERLEVSGFSRNLATFAGLAVGALIWKFSAAYFSSSPSALGWLLPIVFGYLALSISSPIFLILLGDLQWKPYDETAIMHEGPGPAPHSTH
ncbi:MAG TPA: hypothetical protein VEU52_00255 [Candidatus Limnocylindrales bacterium]|nr:hypothetical protein [Candidatus Limnocylindrales bacterium]